MILDVKKIEEVANLARLELSQAEKEMYAEQLSVVFEYVERLNEVDTDNVPETCQVTGLEDITRVDESRNVPEKFRMALINLFPSKLGNLLRVRKVFSDENEL